MLEAENYHAARRATIIAHLQHFGAQNHINPEEETDDSIMNLLLGYFKDKKSLKAKVSSRESPEAGDSKHPSTYTVDFFCTMPREEGSPSSFTYPIPTNTPPYQRVPVECTKPHCPIRHFHYEGLYMDRGMPCSKKSRFGFSDPPREIWQALQRTRAGQAQGKDDWMVKRFAEYHTWLHLLKEIKWVFANGQRGRNEEQKMVWEANRHSGKNWISQLESHNRIDRY